VPRRKSNPLAAIELHVVRSTTRSWWRLLVNWLTFSRRHWRSLGWPRGRPTHRGLRKADPRTGTAPTGSPPAVSIARSPDEFVCGRLAQTHGDSLLSLTAGIQREAER
jgi:hypothetical protein